MLVRSATPETRVPTGWEHVLASVNLGGDPRIHIAGVNESPTPDWAAKIEKGTVLILEGEVHVTDALGKTTVMVPGMLGYFPSGSRWVWHVPAYVRKLSFNRRRVPWLARALAKVLRMVGVVR